MGWWKSESNIQTLIEIGGATKIMLRITMVTPGNFKIKTLKDAEYFIRNILKASIDIQDADDRTLYHSFIVDQKSGEIALGTAHYGKDPLTSEIPVCCATDVVRRTYKIRKSINKALSEKL